MPASEGVQNKLIRAPKKLDQCKCSMINVTDGFCTCRKVSIENKPLTNEEIGPLLIAIPAQLPDSAILASSPPLDTPVRLDNCVDLFLLLSLPL